VVVARALDEEAAALQPLERDANLAQAELQEASACLARRWERIEFDGEPVMGSINGIRHRRAADPLEIGSNVPSVGQVRIDPETGKPPSPKAVARKRRLPTP
jgi:hypothetical protein